MIKKAILIIGIILLIPFTSHSYNDQIIDLNSIETRLELYSLLMGVPTIPLEDLEEPFRKTLHCNVGNVIGFDYINDQPVCSFEPDQFHKSFLDFICDRFNKLVISYDKGILTCGVERKYS